MQKVTVAIPVVGIQLFGVFMFAFLSFFSLGLSITLLVFVKSLVVIVPGLLCLFFAFFFVVSGRRIKTHSFEIDADSNGFTIIHNPSCIARFVCASFKRHDLRLSEVAVFEVIPRSQKNGGQLLYYFRVKLTNQMEYFSEAAIPLEKLQVMGDYIGAYQRSIGNVNFQQGGMLWMTSPYPYHTLGNTPGVVYSQVQPAVQPAYSSPYGSYSYPLPPIVSLQSNPANGYSTQPQLQTQNEGDIAKDYSDYHSAPLVYPSSFQQYPPAGLLSQYHAQPLPLPQSQPQQQPQYQAQGQDEHERVPHVPMPPSFVLGNFPV